MKAAPSFRFLCGTLLAIGGTLVHGGLIQLDLRNPSRNTIPASLEKRDLVDLRILPLGASIVWGKRSDDGNGFRLLLRDQLRWEGYNVNMVGTKSNDTSTMKDKDCEATPGDLIDEIHAASELSYKYKPNLVLINAGTNDCEKSINITTAHVRLKSMINDLWANIGNTTVIIVSTILVNEDASTNANRAIVNPRYRSLVASLQAEGRPIYLTEFAGWITTSDLGPDGTHPNAGGYEKMAGAFWETIARALKDGAIQPPQNVTGCTKLAGSAGVGAAGTETQTGGGGDVDDGVYYHNNTPSTGSISTITSKWDRNQWSLARLFNPERDDILAWFNETDGSITYAVWRNDGDGVITKIDDMTNFPTVCTPRDMGFVDLNGDGLDDFVCITDTDDAAYGAINNGDGEDTRGPTWTYVGPIKAAYPDVPLTQVRMADVDREYELCYGDHTGDDEDPYTDPGLPQPSTAAIADTTDSL